MLKHGVSHALRLIESERNEIVEEVQDSQERESLTVSDKESTDKANIDKLEIEDIF